MKPGAERLGLIKDGPKRAVFFCFFTELIPNYLIKY